MTVHGIHRTQHHEHMHVTNDCLVMMLNMWKNEKQTKQLLSSSSAASTHH